MKEAGILSCRQLIKMSFVLTGILIFGSFYSASSQSARTPTPDQVLGPFYPVIKPLDQDSDLTVIRGKPGRAQGQLIYVEGRVLNLKGEPISGAEVEIWQANSFGRYAHPGDRNPAPLDPSFEGYGIQSTDAAGRFKFKTIKPGAYPASRDWARPPHIHFCVTSKTSRLITQLYFEGEPLNERDLILKSTQNRESLITRLIRPAKDAEPDALVANWDIILRQE